ncbi:hypothetical protein KTQ54_06110 [Komagataeibacter oboediens]|uniref:hypothetical protein n=1 Tax=Komagataeibacter oboediens TaxID=65958 RepID=UPI001C2CA067|nr:hypothetical protein [Komagataeibacter oboediens]MBV0888112.1 hypothetical protein [Komagataeibacter oboediens]MCK9820788.1 hypothetical protein [Komagataeibacter oboediens]
MSQSNELVDTKSALSCSIAKMCRKENGDLKVTVEIPPELFSPLPARNRLPYLVCTSMKAKLVLSAANSDPENRHSFTLLNAFTVIKGMCRSATVRRIARMRRNADGNLELKIKLAADRETPSTYSDICLNIAAEGDILTVSTKEDDAIARILAEVDAACDTAIRFLSQVYGGR